MRDIGEREGHKEIERNLGRENESGTLEREVQRRRGREREKGVER